MFQSAMRKKTQKDGTGIELARTSRFCCSKQSAGSNCKYLLFLWPDIDQLQGVLNAPLKYTGGHF